MTETGTNVLFWDLAHFPSDDMDGKGAVTFTADSSWLLEEGGRRVGVVDEPNEQSTLTQEMGVNI